LLLQKKFRGNAVEIKDAFFPSKAVSSISFDKIREAIDSKYNTDKKGTGQIISQLIKMTNGGFEIPVYGDTTSLTVYPVLVYTDTNFKMPGINNYLKDQFQIKLAASSIEYKYKRIMSITFISLVSELLTSFDTQLSGAGGSRTGDARILSPFCRQILQNAHGLVRIDFY